MYWFPHTDRMMTKQQRPHRPRARRAAAAVPAGGLAATTSSSPTPSSAGCTALGDAGADVIPRVNQVSGRALSERTYSDLAHRVFTSPRRVRFREMEYAVPREVGLDGAPGGAAG